MLEPGFWVGEGVIIMSGPCRCDAGEHHVREEQRGHFGRVVDQTQSHGGGRLESLDGGLRNLQIAGGMAMEGTKYGTKVRRRRQKLHEADRSSPSVSAILNITTEGRRVGGKS